MSASKQISLSGLPRGELEALAERLLAENDALRQVIAGLKAEVATLKGVKGRPEVKPSGMEKGTEPAPAGSRAVVPRAARAARLAVHEERVVAAADVPAGSRFKGYEDFLVQDLVLRPHVVRLRRERWLTPDGRTVVAPMPAGIVGHFGPELRRFVLAQYHQGQVTVPRLVAQLRAIGILISKRQVVRLLNAGQDAFLAEAREVLRAGLSRRGLDQRRRHRRPPPAPQRRLHPARQRPLRRLRHDGLEEPAELPGGAARRLHATTSSMPRRSPTCASALAGPVIAALGRASRAALPRRGGLAGATWSGSASPR